MSTIPNGYRYRKSITLSRASGAVTNYQMKILVGESSGSGTNDVHCNGHCQSTFNDLRFVSSSGVVLDYWIESISGTTHTQVATVWIEFDSIGTGDTTFYMYYGNSVAAAYSNGANTFLFFDDFSVDLTKWTNLVGTASISGGRMLLDSTESVKAASFSVATCAMSVKVQVSAANKEANLGLSDYGSSTIFNTVNNDSAWFYLYTDGHVYTESDLHPNREEKDVGASSYDTSEHKYDILVIVDTSSAFYIDGTLKETHTVRKPHNALFPCFRNSSNTSMYVDNVYVRQYLATEPAWGAWGVEVFTLPQIAVGNAWKDVSVRKVCISNAWKEIIEMKVCENSVWELIES